MDSDAIYGGPSGFGVLWTAPALEESFKLRGKCWGARQVKWAEHAGVVEKEPLSRNSCSRSPVSLQKPGMDVADAYVTLKSPLRILRDKVNEEMHVYRKVI